MECMHESCMHARVCDRARVCTRERTRPTLTPTLTDYFLCAGDPSFAWLLIAHTPKVAPAFTTEPACMRSCSEPRAPNAKAVRGQKRQQAFRCVVFGSSTARQKGSKAFTMRCMVCGCDKGPAGFSGAQKKRPAAKRKCTACTAANGSGAQVHAGAPPPSLPRQAAEEAPREAAHNSTTPAPRPSRSCGGRHHCIG